MKLGRSYGSLRNKAGNHFASLETLPSYVRFVGASATDEISYTAKLLICGTCADKPSFSIRRRYTGRRSIDLYWRERPMT